MDGLKPCPFCGSTCIERVFITKYIKYYLRCLGCGIEQKLYKTEDDAVNAWNTRTKKRSRRMQKEEGHRCVNTAKKNFMSR